MNRRRSLTEKEKRAVIRKQGDRCAMCGGSFSWLECEELKVIEFDHWTPVALGNDAKPDAAMHRICHARKTKRDVKAIAKVKRIVKKHERAEMRRRVRLASDDPVGFITEEAQRAAGLTKHKAKISSRPFDKTFKRKVSGETVRREG